MATESKKLASRRAVLKGLGSLGALGLFHCGGSTSPSADGTDGGSSSSSSGSSGASSSGASSSSGSSGTAFGDAGIDAAAFAVGSGAFLDGKDYGDPFASGAGTTCTVYPSATAGPCHSNTYDRKDVSDGLVGLPTRFELLVVDGACNPVAGAIVEIWYASPAGTYSKAAEQIDDATGYKGSLSDLNVGFCTGNDAEATASKWLRGFQVADANGRVTIDGVFPGWYSGRTTHVHFIVTANGHSSVTSQLVFDETLTTAVYTKHGSYSARGDKDTTNAKDNVLSQGLSAATALMTCTQQSDGAIVAYKAITIG